MSTEEMDLIIENGTFLTMDGEGRVIEDGFLCVRKDRICRIESGRKRDANLQSRKTLDAEGGLVLPGLINGHTHAAMSLFRGLADDLPLMEWLTNYIFPVESRMDAEFVYAGTQLACAEMIMSGSTTFCDMYLFEDQVAMAGKEAGMRCLVGEVTYDFPSPHYGPVENALPFSESLIRAWEKDPLVHIAVEPHSLFTCSPDLLKSSGELARRYGVPLIIHVAETEAEVEDVKKRYGRRPVDHLASLGLLDSNLIADHCVHLTPLEIDALAESGVRVVHTPESNMKLASGVAPVSRMLSKGIVVGLGTDGCASNNNLDLFGEMDSAAKLAKVNAMDPTVMDAETVLRMATINGATALGLGEITGSLEPGKKADIIVVDTKKPHLTPLYNPYSHMVYSARGSDVRHSLIDGRLVMEDRRLLTLDLDSVMDRAREKARDVEGWLK